MSETILVAGFAASAAIVGSFLTYVGTRLTLTAQRGKATAEEDKITVDTALSIIAERNEEVGRLKAELQVLEGRVDTLEKWAKALVAQVIEAGHIPVSFEEWT